MYQTPLNTAQPGPRSVGHGHVVLDDPTRGLEKQAPSESRRDPIAGAPASLLSDPTRGLEGNATTDAERDPAAGARARLLTDLTRGLEDRAPYVARRDPTS